SDTYHAESANFGTLFTFGDGSISYRNYQDRDHFIHGYPFVPYQFPLFQATIQNLSDHNAFEGRHSSVGERSMLGVFQQVAKRIGAKPIGELATFDLMFEGIRAALKANIQRAILLAESELRDPFAVRVLKALFLVKYVKEFKASTRNLGVLMLERFDQDLDALHKQVEQALNLLEQQTYIQRNGELYAYLTDEEKDVEEEIKITEVESSDVADELQTLIFDQVLKTKKIRYDLNGQDYPFSRKLDDQFYGREQELTIHIISPFNEHAGNEELIRTNSVYHNDVLFVLLPQEDRLMRDLLMYKRTEKYIRQNTAVTQQDSIKRILTDKAHQNRERYQQLQELVARLLGYAKLLVAGSDVDLGSEDAQARVTKGFNELIARAYPNLRMLRDIRYNEADVASYLQRSQEGLLGADATALAESEQEILAFIQGNSRAGVRTTLKGVLEQFARKPYGWYYAAILCNLALLCARGKVEVRSDGNLLEDSALAHALLNTQGTGNVVIEPQVEFTASQVRALKAFYEDFFDAAPSASEAKALGKEAAGRMQALRDELDALTAEAKHYPFLQQLKPVIERLDALLAKPYTWYLTELGREEDRLLDLKEELIDPLRRFMDGPQRAIYDEATRFLQAQESNFGYLQDDNAGAIRSALHAPDCFKGSRMQQLKTELDSLQQAVAKELQATRKQAEAMLEQMQQRMQGMDEYKRLPEARTDELDSKFDELRNHFAQQPLIAVINDLLRRFEEQGYQVLLRKMVEMANPQPKEPDHRAGKESTQVEDSQKAEYVVAKTLIIPFDKPFLAEESDVERYLDALRDALISAIHQGKRVQI
ncbi:MAG: BREX system P-loop protein BrxC, partial [Gammaproteobacteria bacterium]|nr:BREX system P-loop protein BrxC [Gammaproteobacteria bacterium]